MNASLKRASVEGRGKGWQGGGKRGESGGKERGWVGGRAMKLGTEVGVLLVGGGKRGDGGGGEARTSDLISKAVILYLPLMCK